MKKPLLGCAALSCLAPLFLIVPALGLSAGIAAAADASNLSMPNHVDRFYVAFHAGAVFPGKIIDNVGPPVSGRIEVDGNVGSRFGGAVGFMVNPNVAIEGEVAFVKVDPKSASLVSGPASPMGPFNASGTASVTTGMVNVLLGAPMGQWHPYVGAGAGLAYFNAGNVMAGSLGPLDGSDTGLGLQAIAGIDFALTNAVSIGARYRYLHVSGISITDTSAVDNDITAQFQSVEGTVTLHFGN